jgi:hypothetical protein
MSALPTQILRQVSQREAARHLGMRTTPDYQELPLRRFLRRFMLEAEQS